MKHEAKLKNRARETDSTNISDTEQKRYDIKAIKSLLNEFDGTGGDYYKWEQQIELLREIYKLEDGTLRVLITTKLKGKALNWFHSKPEHIRLTSIELLKEMRGMYDRRPSRLALRKEFERRTWRTGESFNEYCHDKVILGNRVPIDQNEIVDYIIDGMSDLRLQDQTRMQRFESVSEVIEAFEKITLRNYAKPERSGKEFKAKKEGTDKDRKTQTGEGHEGRISDGLTRLQNMRCYNFQQRGHLSADCTESRVVPRGKSGDQASSTTGKAVNPSTQLNVIHQAADIEPYVVSASYTAQENEGKETRQRCVKAILDTGSPISLIRSRFVPGNQCRPITEDSRYAGINNSRIELIGSF